MNKTDCSLVEDLLPLYTEGEVREETKRYIENHLRECSICRQLYSEAGRGTFEEFPLHEPEMPREKRFLLRVKKLVVAVAVVLIAAIMTSAVLSYQAGRVSGVYGERFRLAEDKGLLIDVNAERKLGENSIVLEKALLDNSVTSLIIKSSYALDDFDSVTLRDDRENVYSRVDTFFGLLPEKYRKVNGYTILDFKPVDKGAKRLILEMIKWKPYPAQKLIFEVNVEGRERLEASGEYRNLLDTFVSDVGLRVERMVSGTSQTEMYFVLDRQSTAFDGVSPGWYYRELLKSGEKVLLTDSLTGRPVPVLSIEDVTDEKPPAGDGGTLSNRYRVAMEPLPQKTGKLQLQFKDLYGFYNLENEELVVDFSKKEEAVLNREIAVNNLILSIQSAYMKNGGIGLNYVVKDKDGRRLDNYMLDARIRGANDRYAVPEQGMCGNNGTENTIVWSRESEKKYVISLSRLGLRLESKPYDIELK